MDSRLEAKRFDPTPESMRNMKELRKVYREQEKKFKKSLLGISFFGSRILGKEKMGEDGKPSDLDVCVFFDTNEISIPLREKFLDFMEKNLRNLRNRWV